MRTWTKVTIRFMIIKIKDQMQPHLLMQEEEPEVSEEQQKVIGQKKRTQSSGRLSTSMMLKIGRKLLNHSLEEQMSSDFIAGKKFLIQI